MTGWLQKHTGTGQALLNVDIHNVLAYMLLHELGHIVHGDLVEKGESSDTAVPATGFNLDLTQQKDREISADRYAADAISSAIAARGTDRGPAATAVAMTLSQLSWNLAEHRLLDNFGGTALHHPSLFWDTGLSHPNLEWRILSVNDEISKTTVSHQLLSDFESSRHSQPLVLYRTPEL
jgi:Zn-dependent protease with chaperone function